MDDDLLRDLLDRWVERWAHGRDIALRRTDSGWLADVAAPTRQREHVAVSPTTADAELLSRAARSEPGTWISVLGTAPDLLAKTLRPVTVGEECMMTTRIEAREVPERVELDVDGSRVRAIVREHGDVIARGSLVVADGIAVVDKVETDPAHRRRGLGRDVMTALEQHARTGGAQTGLLIASPAGRGLYESMGWRWVAPLSIFAGPS